MSDQPDQQHLIIYNTKDGKAAVSLYARDGNVWMNQAQLSELFATSVPNISTHISNILKEKELDRDSVVKDYLTTAADGKKNHSCKDIHDEKRTRHRATQSPNF